MLTLLVAIGVLAAGCASDPTIGYSATSVFSSEIRSIAVPIFENKTFVRDVEFELTDALIKEIESRTPYRVTSQAGADSILIGTIREIEMDQLSKSRQTGLGEEVIVSVTIDFQWKTMLTDRVIVERRAFAGHGLFHPSAPLGERVELGRFAAVQFLARDIVDELRASW